MLLAHTGGPLTSPASQHLSRRLCKVCEHPSSCTGCSPPLSRCTFCNDPMSKSRTQTILVAEDDRDDAFLLKRAFTRAGAPTSLQFAIDGQEAVDYLQGRGCFSDRINHPLP